MLRAKRQSRWVALVLGAMLMVTAAPVAAAGPDVGDDPPPTPETRIIGGTTSPAGAWPSQVALLDAHVGENFYAQYCGGTVINPSWILTAAHCVVDTGISAIDVLAKTQSLASGGQRHRVASTRVAPSYNAYTFNNDIALLHLGTPTDAPLQAIAAQGAGVAAGTRAVTTGWGNLSSTGNSYPMELQQVSVPIIANSVCASYYPGQITSSMLCAGQAPYVSVDSCQGDSGGPLIITQGDRLVQVGVTSWGDGCAAGFPGVYARVATFSNWIKSQVRFGPHATPNAFVSATSRDLYNAPPTAAQLFTGVAAQNSVGPAAWLTQQIQSRTYQARMGGVTRLYRAFFLRDPDSSGMNFWWGRVNDDWTMWRTAEFFSQSPEFIGRYGSLSNEGYVDLVYQNVLGRAPEAAGRAFWVNELAGGARNRGEVMVGFSESPEYVAANKARTDVLITYFALAHRVPVESDIAFWMTQPNASLVATLFGSLEYHRRF